MTDSTTLERELFGTSSEEEGGKESDDDGDENDDDKDDDEEQTSSSFELVRGSRFPEGLDLHRRALSSEASRALFDTLRASLGDDDNNNNSNTQAFFFGLESLPAWALALSRAAASRVARTWPKRELAERIPLFDMAAVNLYSSSSSSSSVGEGENSNNANDDCLRQHVDLARFRDGVAVFSLGTAAVMRFEEVVADVANDKSKEGDSSSNRSGGGGGGDGGGIVAVLLRDGDLLTMRGEARWRWTHGFGGGDHFFKGERVVRRGGQRIGVTLRRMENSGEDEKGKK